MPIPPPDHYSPANWETFSVLKNGKKCGMISEITHQNHSLKFFESILSSSNGFRSKFSNHFCRKAMETPCCTLFRTTTHESRLLRTTCSRSRRRYQQSALSGYLSIPACPTNIRASVHAPKGTSVASQACPQPGCLSGLSWYIQKN